MNKHFKFIIFLVLFSCNTKEKKTENEKLQVFKEIEIDFTTGDEVIKRYTLRIFKEGETIKVDKTRPFYYYGSGTDSIWTTEIGNTELQIINQFLKKAKTIDSCSSLSSSIDHYTIKIGGKQQIEIRGNCDWQNLDYKSLEFILFQKQFEELDKKRKAVADSIVNSLNGSWDVNGWRNGALENRNVILTKNNSSEPTKEGFQRWVFKKSKVEELIKSLDIDEGSTLIEIRGSTYRIKSIGTEIIELEYLW